ncbi:hypothetical protein FEM48_Zijuj01G0270200 [Ziziphus jujuba var. spinosa]|uniref:Uncharacterized protein n=1 Tax=Ziziphus jujuba var. spinosa TaxID=714518 RepID=A0A978W556_ZIZJJ|nr:hypothetical protein FEM48_Zijuj01G0270200 [Ziziphus jujuba var. spinosa]
MPTYSMTTFLLPSGVYDDLDGLVRKFWWESKPNAIGYLALKAWKDICKPKEFGGLGFRKFKDMNLALLVKLEWKLARREECLWTRMMKAKYLQNEIFFGYSLKKGLPSKTPRAKEDSVYPKWRRVFECWDESNCAWKAEEIRKVCDEELAEAILKMD